MFQIPSEKVQLALDWLEENAGSMAAARAERERAAYRTKITKAKMFLEQKGNNAEREAKAINTPEFIDAMMNEAEAIQVDEEYRNNRSKCEAIIDAWRTTTATARAASRIG